MLGSCEHGDEHPSSIKFEECFGYMRNYYLVRKSVLHFVVVCLLVCSSRGIRIVTHCHVVILLHLLVKLHNKMNIVFLTRLVERYRNILLMFSLSTKSHTGRFIMFFVITNIYNKETKGPILMEFFTATEKLKKVFFDN